MRPRHLHSPHDQQGFEGFLDRLLGIEAHVFKQDIRRRLALSRQAPGCSEHGAAIRVGLRGSGGQAAYTSRPSRTAGPMMVATPCLSASTSSGVTTTMSIDAGTPMSAR